MKNFKKIANAYTSIKNNLSLLLFFTLLGLLIGIIYEIFLVHPLNNIMTYLFLYGYSYIYYGFNYTWLFVLFGVITGLIAAAFADKNKIKSPEEIENELKFPVLGSIPWIDKNIYNDTNAVSLNDNIISFYSIAYQNIISMLKVKSSKFNIKSLAFTSSEYSKQRSTTLMNIGYSLSKAGQKVILVDADFRTPSVNKEFGLLPSSQHNLENLIPCITNEIRDSGKFNWSLLSYFIQGVEEAENLHILANNGSIENPEEFLYSNAFNMLLRELKDQYDFVLIDTPPIMAIPDAAVISLSTDATVLVAGINSDKKQIKSIKRVLNNYNVDLLGVIAREEEKQEAVSQNKYIIQLISAMINRKSGSEKGLSC